MQAMDADFFAWILTLIFARWLLKSLDHGQRPFEPQPGELLSQLGRHS